MIYAIEAEVENVPWKYPPPLISPWVNVLRPIRSISTSTTATDDRPTIQKRISSYDLYNGPRNGRGNENGPDNTLSERIQRPQQILYGTRFQTTIDTTN